MDEWMDASLIVFVCYDSCIYVSKRVLTMIVQAPEIITMKKGDDPYSTKSDMYAYGSVLYELTARQLPYPGRQPVEVCACLIGKCDSSDWLHRTP